ncbi:S41 family peptidase [Xanthomonas vesicatoria]|uniref:S41 family peptidase n=2 Tax=Xanthomonas vesicatoria TaxID=56460 RepID=UPI0007323F63|nr:S41 family peptidase [Xanthomonas vesicatoria]MCC8558121.1 S41 family peptidase [Xanthomonas vesicatoria]MCC8674122.1 S41 family peptidase [Xanthomonas vesicatoria]MCC8683096.1 S41 family peptidase [Xanthomonas vesicatoria]MDG4492402.1 peptidase S41 [Xanthomonas vesicatoria]
MSNARMRWWLVGWLLFCMHATAAAAAPWRLVAGGTDYQLEAAQGDVQTPEGARLRLTAGAKRTAAFGAVAVHLDALPLRGQSLALDGLLHASQAMQGAHLWVRAVDAQGKVLAFRTSQAEPVSGGQQACRSIALKVPMQTHRLAVGVVLEGNGAVEVSHLRLTAQPGANTASATEIMDVALPAIRYHALQRNRIDWGTREPQLRAQAADMREADAYVAIDALIAELDDGHSFLIRPTARRQVEARAAKRPTVKARLLQPDIGYIEVTGLMTSSGDVRGAYQRALAAALDGMASQAHCGWIVDLRQNTGGTMWPMVNGLHALLGDQLLGYFVDSTGRQMPWHAKPAAGTHASQAERAVAVLIGPHTASAGEMVAIAFRGRPATRSFGQPSAGKTTGNRSVDLPGGGVLAIASSATQDRNAQQLDGALHPDVVSDPQEDAIDAAAQWLRTQRCVELQ